MCFEHLVGLYEIQLYSIPKISSMLGMPQSTVRNRLIKSGVSLRSRKEGCKISCHNFHLKGKKRPPFSKEWKDRISQSRLAWASQNAKGLSLKPNGYLEITRGENKGRSLHVFVMEQMIGRKLKKGECVHHIDENKTNNHPSNLQLMTLSSHAKLHAKQNHRNRKRENNGRFS